MYRVSQASSNAVVRRQLQNAERAEQHPKVVGSAVLLEGFRSMRNTNSCSHTRTPVRVRGYITRVSAAHPISSPSLSHNNHSHHPAHHHHHAILHAHPARPRQPSHGRTHHACAGRHGSYCKRSVLQPYVPAVSAADSANKRVSSTMQHQSGMRRPVRQQEVEVCRRASGAASGDVSI
jgi:hypothetical protein